MKLGYLAIVVVGACVSIMAYAVGLESFSGAWWAFVLAANTLAAFSSHVTEAPATP